MGRLKQAAEGLLDLLYPPYCVTCGKDAEGYLCAECLSKVVFIEHPCCRRCGAPSPALRCSECHGRGFAFDSAHCAGIYEGVLRDAIHALKYRFYEVLAEPLGTILTNRFPASFVGYAIDCVVPIPIHRSRMLRRGFNQSELLAERLCDGLNLALEPGVLYQKRRTRHQANLPQEKRLGNVVAAFAVRNAERIRGKRVLLIDDVFTTGSTLNEAAAALRSAGAAAVHAYTLARSV